MVQPSKRFWHHMRLDVTSASSSIQLPFVLRQLCRDGMQNIGGQAAERMEVRPIDDGRRRFRNWRFFFFTSLLAVESMEGPRECSIGAAVPDFVRIVQTQINFAMFGISACWFFFRKHCCPSNLNIFFVSQVPIIKTENR